MRGCGHYPIPGRPTYSHPDQYAGAPYGDRSSSDSHSDPGAARHQHRAANGNGNQATGYGRADTHCRANAHPNPQALAPRRCRRYSRHGREPR